MPARPFGHSHSPSPICRFRQDADTGLHQPQRGPQAFHFGGNPNIPMQRAGMPRTRHSAARRLVPGRMSRRDGPSPASSAVVAAEEANFRQRFGWQHLGRFRNDAACDSRKLQLALAAGCFQRRVSFLELGGRSPVARWCSVIPPRLMWRCGIRSASQTEDRVNVKLDRLARDHSPYRFIRHQLIYSAALPAPGEDAKAMGRNGSRRFSIPSHR